MPKKALLVVDIQNDFCPGGALGVPDGEQVVEPSNKMMEFADNNRWLILVSRDWHPKDSEHFKKWPVHCVEYSHGAQFHPKLKIVGRAYIVSKGMNREDDAYSPFEGFSCDCGKLMEFLQSVKVEEIYICGLATDYCVKAAALDSKKGGYKTFLLIDACRAVNIKPGDGEKSIQEMKDAGVIITITDKVLKGN